MSLGPSSSPPPASNPKSGPKRPKMDFANLDSDDSRPAYRSRTARRLSRPLRARPLPPTLESVQTRVALRPAEETRNRLTITGTLGPVPLLVGPSTAAFAAGIFMAISRGVRCLGVAVLGPRFPLALAGRLTAIGCRTLWPFSVALGAAATRCLTQLLQNISHSLLRVAYSPSPPVPASSYCGATRAARA